ncbi:MAG: Uncharacterized protein FD159_59 [Syntrophaceae bacterium]|nr:MAG: Uncharacterized protein FD159_59 [Syntrophaceae bacterium]
MSRVQKKGFSRLLLLTGMVIVAGAFLFTGCATVPKTLNSAVAGPQVIVNPDSVSLGAATLLGTKIVFEGSGYPPGDDVFVTLYGPKGVEPTVADGKVQADGKFTATAGLLAKVTGMLNANISGTYKKDGSYDQFVVLTKPAIPAGVYKVVATAMLSGQSSETTLIIKDPSIVDGIKNLLGEMMGKIQDKRP